MHRSYLENLERRFLEANELTTAEEQEEYLSTLSAHDEQMADELRMLLALRTEATSMFDSDHEECFSLLLTTLGESKRIESKEELLDFLSETSPAESPGSMATIRGYSLVELVGTGPTGFVFRGWDPVMKRAVAIKVLAPSISCVAERRNVFLQEASLAGSVEHKNVCTIYHVSSEFDSNLVFYVAEWVQGETMDRWIRKQEVFPNDESIRFLVQLIHGVGAIHAKGIVHRDLKPGNLMLDSEREVLRIIDFGLAHEVSLTSANQLPAGTPMYMSPEQMRGERLTQSSDLFALGCIACVLITGFHPFESDSLKDLSKNLLERGPRLDQAIYQENPAFFGVMNKALSELPADRFSSAESFGDALFSVLTPAQQAVWHKTGQKLEAKESETFFTGSLSWKSALVIVSLFLLLTMGAFWMAGYRSDSVITPNTVSNGFESGKWISENAYRNFLGMELRRFPSPNRNVKQWPPVADRPELFVKLGWQNYENDMWVGNRLVTRRQYLDAMGELPEGEVRGGELDKPVGNVTFEDACAFCEKLNSIDPDGLKYGPCNKSTVTYATYGWPIVSGQKSVGELSRTFKEHCLGNGPLESPFGVGDVFAEHWEWVDESNYKTPNLDGVVSYRLSPEISKVVFCDILNGGRNDIFVHAHDMNYGMNDFLHDSNNLHSHLEEDGVTSYLSPIVAGQRAWVTYRYQFCNPIEKASVINPIRLHDENSRAGIRIRFRDQLEELSIDECPWVSVFETNGMFLIHDKKKAPVDLSSHLKGAVEVDVEYWSQADGERLNYCQIGRTVVPNSQVGVFQFEATLQGGRLESMRQWSSIPSEYRHPNIGFRVSLSAEPPAKYPTSR